MIKNNWRFLGCLKSVRIQETIQNLKRKLFIREHGLIVYLHMGSESIFEKYVKPADIIVYIGIALLAISFMILSFSTLKEPTEDIFYSRVKDIQLPVLGISVRASFFVLFVGLFVVNSLVYKHDREIWQEDRKELFKLKDETLPQLMQQLHLITQHYNEINIRLAKIDTNIDNLRKGGKK